MFLPYPFHAAVFAPTNDAFDALPEGVLDSLLADPDKLTDILLYHVVEGQVEAQDIPDLLDAATLNGQSVVLRSDDDGVTVNDATVVIADVLASNGVIHVIDKVLIPEGVLASSPISVSNTIVDVAMATDATSTLVAALQAANADVIKSLSGPGPFSKYHQS